MTTHLLLTLALTSLGAADRPVRLEAGVLRWADTGEELALFGVNYYAPHWHDYERLGLLGCDRRRVIEQDVRHLRRLGLDLLRVHVFDREVSDAEGNLLANEHLALLDHLLATCRAHGLYAVLTPIAWWPTPNPGSGFSSRFTMPQMTSDLAARAAQQRYLAQFVSHRNPATGLTYAEDPQVIAFELINEPLYPQGLGDAQVTAYIDALAGAVRATGCRKPLFYNGWGGRGKALAASSIDGGTHGWYPTGLVAGATLAPNQVHKVDRYWGFDDFPPNKPRGIYEFDAADVNGSYMYPAMARAFRAAGAQFAAQFQYDGWPLAATNANWQTHWLSLPYAPGKALSFAIAAESFRRRPRGPVAGEQPGSERFGDFRCSFADDLSEWASATAFLHSNDTRTVPPRPERLTRLAGVGSSPLVGYDGTGAWFLDRRAPGVWRCEVYPDAVQVDDPHGPTALAREVCRLVWTRRTLAVELPDLRGRFELEPGVWELRPGGATRLAEPDWFAPPAGDGPPVVWHEPAEALRAGRPVTIRATCVPAAGAPVLVWQDGATWQRQPLTQVRAYRYATELAPGAARPPAFRYRLELTRDGQPLSFPGALPTGDLDTPPRTLFDAAQLAKLPPLGFHGAPGQRAAAKLVDGRVQASVTGFGPAPSAASLRLSATSPGALPAGGWKVVVKARASEAATTRVELGLVQDDGRAWGWDVPLAAELREVELPLEQLRPLWSTRGRLDPARISELSLIFGAWLYGEQHQRPHGVELAQVRLERRTTWLVPVEPADASLKLLRPSSARWRPVRGGGVLSLAAGPTGEPALAFAHPGFGPPPDCASLHLDLGGVDQAALAGSRRLRVVARSESAAATAVELVLTEHDGTPWGLNVPLKNEWTTLDLPLDQLKFFAGWPHPADRGGPGDRLRSERLGALHLTFGAWLNPGAQREAWRFALAAVELGR
jgi:hypothetical protein